MKVYNKNELRDSRIFFDRLPPPFFAIFIWFTIILLCVSLLVASQLIRNHFVEAEGTVITTDNTFVSSLTDGALVELLYESGDFVNIDDVLFTVSSGNEGLQNSALREQIQHQQELIEAMDLYS